MLDSDRFTDELGRLTPPTLPPETTVKARPRRGPRRLAMGATLVAVIGMVGVLLLRSNTGSTTVLSATAPIAAVSQPASALSGGSVQASAIAAKVDPAVVDINTVFQTASGSGTAAGTGIILTSTGEVLTNNHVVNGATSITVQIAGRTGTYTASVVGVDPTADIALIQLNGV